MNTIVEGDRGDMGAWLGTSPESPSGGVYSPKIFFRPDLVVFRWPTRPLEGRSTWRASSYKLYVSRGDCVEAKSANALGDAGAAREKPEVVELLEYDILQGCFGGCGCEGWCDGCLW